MINLSRKKLMATKTCDYTKLEDSETSEKISTALTAKPSEDASGMGPHEAIQTNPDADRQDDLAKTFCTAPASALQDAFVGGSDYHFKKEKLAPFIAHEMSQATKTTLFEHNNPLAQQVARAKVERSATVQMFSDAPDPARKNPTPSENTAEALWLPDASGPSAPDLQGKRIFNYSRLGITKHKQAEARKRARYERIVDKTQVQSNRSSARARMFAELAQATRPEDSFDELEGSSGAHPVTGRGGLGHKNMRGQTERDDIEREIRD